MICRFLRSGLRRSVSCTVVAVVLASGGGAFAAPQAGPGGVLPGQSAVESTSVPVVQSTALSPTRMLNGALARLARDPRDMIALLDAGGAALDLGDTDAAIGFLTRAEQVSPGNAGVRARIGIAMLRASQPFEAIRWFDLADQAGFDRTEMATERGLAYDLIGDNAAAQRQYQLAIAGGQNDEASRRYALSLVIAGDRRGAELVIQPLLERRDRGAWRVRTFIMAISGQSDEAEGIARATMPADLAAAISPYLRYMPRLTPAQQAAAANLGRFPRAADIGRDDPQIVQYALAHPRAPRVDAGLVPQGEALGARGRDDRDSRAKRRRPGKDERRETAMAAAKPAPAPAAPAVSAPWGLQPGTRTAAAPQQPVVQQVVPPAPQPATQQPRPVVLSKLDVPPGTALAPPPAPRVVAAAPQVTPPPAPTLPAPVPPPGVTPAPAPAPAPTPAPGPAPTQVAAATLPAPGPQLALAAPLPSNPPAPQPAAAPDQAPPLQQSPAPLASPPVPAPVSAPVPAGAPADFRSMFDGFKPPEQEAAATTDAVDLARIEALRVEARAAATKAVSARAKDRGERPDGPTAVSRTSDQDAAEPAVVTRAGKDKAAKDAAAKEAASKAGKDKLALKTDCPDPAGKDKAGKGKSAKGKAAAKPGAKSGAKSGRGKSAAEAQCPPETDKAKKGKNGKSEPAHASRIWVQVLTGSNREGMGKEWQRLVREASALKSRKPYITPWRSNYRLLTGPFASEAEAQAFLGALRKDGVSAFQWTSPAGQAVDGLGVK